MANPDINIYDRKRRIWKNLPKLITFGLVFLFIGSTNIHGQNCKGYEKKCNSAPSGFKSSSLSRSISMRKMRKVLINQVLYGDRTYYLSVCGKNKLGKIHFRVLADDEQRSVLYDNAIDNFKTNKLFEIQTTMKVIIEITAPHYFDDRGSECAGISVAYRKN